MSPKDVRDRGEETGTTLDQATPPGKSSRADQRYGAASRPVAEPTPAPDAAPAANASPAALAFATDDPFAMHQLAAHGAAPPPATQAKGDRLAHLDPERVFEGVGNQEAAWDQFDTLLDDKHLVPGVVAMVRGMNSENRGKVNARIDEVAAIVTGDELLIIAELVGVLTREGVMAALSCATRPSAAQMRSFLDREDRRFIALELDDPAVIAALRRVFPGSPVAILPDITIMLSFDELRRWFFAETPAELAARTLLRADDPSTTATQLVGRGSWTWVPHVTNAMTAMNPDAVEAYAKACPEADYRDFLLAKHAHREQGGSGGGHEDELRKELRGRTVDPDQVNEHLAVIEGLAADHVSKPGNRKKILATASAAQIDESTTLMSLAPAERLRWMVDGPVVKLPELRDAVATWPDEVRREAIDTKLVAAIRKRWPEASPADVYGRVPDTVPGFAGSDETTRRWIVERGTPHEILQMLVIAPSRTPELVTWMNGAGGGWGWLDRMGAGLDDIQLRRLMLRCDDDALVKRIQTQLVGDWTPPDSERALDVGKRPRAEADPNDRLADKGRWQSGADLAQTAGELDDTDVAQLHNKPDEMARLVERTQGASLVRVLYAADLPLLTLLQRKKVTDENVIERAQVAGWLRTRSDDDVVKALSNVAAASVAEKLWPAAPLESFPQLRKPEVMARVLTENPSLVEWIVKRSDPLVALHALGAGRAAKAAAEAFGEDSSLVEWLPSGKLLSSRDRSYLYELARHADGRARKRLRERIDADSTNLDEGEVDERSDHETRAERDSLPLDEALQEMLSARFPVEDIIATCRRRAADVPALLADTNLMVRVIAHVDLSPIDLFPGLTLSKVLSRQTLIDPTLERTPSFLLVTACGADAALAAIVAAGLDAADYTYVGPIRRMPKAAALSPPEQAGLEALCGLVKNGPALRELFQARWGSGISEAYDAAETRRLWRTMARVPESHVEHFQVSRFHEMAVGPDGLFDPASKAINMKEGLIADTDGTDINDRSIPDQFGNNDETALMTTAEMMAAFELTEEQIKERIKAGTIEKVGDKLRIAPVNVSDRFTAVALHEIGHAVDDRIKQTSFTNGVAGWKQFGDADYESWARELGGWEDVAAADRREILEAWTLWTNSSKKAGRPERGIEQLVVGPHPIKDPKYQHVGLVAMAMGGFGEPENPFIANGRAHTLNGYYQQRYSVPLASMHAAPSAYSMTAPGEYFAECYMTYYLTYDGTTATAKEKGKLLAPWIKRWFDENIDALGETPKRR
jgi:hypothetical protein